MTPARGRLAAVRLCWRSHRMSRDELLAFQDLQLRRLVAHAYARVPRYRRLFDHHGLRPQDIRGTADLSRIPITTRGELQSAAPEDVVARGARRERLDAHATSGTTGTPLRVWRSLFEARLRKAFRLRTLRHFGVRSRDRQVGVGMVRPHIGEDGGPLAALGRRLGFYRRVILDLRSGDERIAEGLVRLRPDVLLSYATVLDHLTAVLGAERLAQIRPRLLVSGAEVLAPAMGQRIARAFDAPVYDWYGSHEFGLLAWQCGRTPAYHVADDNVLLEVLGDDGRPVAVGEPGEVVATSLHGFAMPIIRYRLGDVVTQGPAPCPCGQPYGTILTIEGRMPDYFPLANGRTVHAYDLYIGLLDVARPWLGQCLITQERPDKVGIELVPRTAPGPDDLAAMRTVVQDTLGPGIEHDLRVTARIDLPPGRRFRFARSLVASPYDQVDWSRRRAEELDAVRGGRPPR
jgi:phenylacetate-CoA ligase